MFVHSIEPHEALGVESPNAIGISLQVGWLKYVAFKDIHHWTLQLLFITIVNSLFGLVLRLIRKGKRQFSVVVFH